MTLLEQACKCGRAAVTVWVWHDPTTGRTHGVPVCDEANEFYERTESGLAWLEFWGSHAG